MPKQPSYITVPAVIDKADIAEFVPLKGCANALHYSAGGRTHQPGGLQFVTFAGRRRADGKYAGQYRFLPGDWQEIQRADFNQLPQRGDNE